MQKMKKHILKVKYNFYKWLYEYLKNKYPPIKKKWDNRPGYYTVINPKVMSTYDKYNKYKWLMIEDYYSNFESIYKKDFPQRPNMRVNIMPNKSRLN